jgi:hypothetical protein
LKSPARIVLAALGNSPWVPLDYIQHPFQVSIAGLMSSGAAFTWSVQYTYDEISFDQAKEDVTIARAGTTATVTWPNHDMVTGDSTIILGSGSAALDSQVDTGGRPISSDITVVDASTFTYTVANTGPTVSNGFAKAMRLRVFPHAVLTAVTTRLDSNFNLPCKGLRYQITAYTSGRLIGLVTQGGPP